MTGSNADLMAEFEEIARLYPSPPPPPPPTPEQIAAGRQRMDAQQREWRQREQDRIFREWQASYPRTSGVPKVFLHKHFVDLDESTDEQRAAVDACWDFMDNWRKRCESGVPMSLWLLGPPGTGKTRTASALVTALHLEDGVSARIVKARAVIDRIRDSWGRSARERKSDVLHELAEVEVLVLDDIAADLSGTDNERQLLFEVIDARSELGHPTLLTSNEDPAGLLRVLGPRCYDRLKHGARVLPLTKKRYRLTDEEMGAPAQA